jgi:hypothetical protein
VAHFGRPLHESTTFITTNTFPRRQAKGSHGGASGVRIALSDFAFAHTLARRSILGMEEQHNSRQVPWVKLRVGAGLFGLLLAAFGLLGLGEQYDKGFEPLTAGVQSAIGTTGILLGWFALRGHLANSRVRMAHAMIGGAIVGGIGLVAGFFGPLIFAPGANQGPLLGIFITGPLGFVSGFVLGAIVGFVRIRH